MFANTVQSSLLSLFSSTGSDPLQLFYQHVDKDLPEDSFIHLLNDTTNEPTPSPPRKLIHSILDVEDTHHSARKKTLCQTVLHIQSPTIRSTYIRCPARSSGSKRNVLGLKHPWINLQVRNLGHDWAFEVGVVDNMNTPGIMRFSTFQKEIAVKATHDPPLLVVPLRFPVEDSNPLTYWSTISIDLSSVIRQYQYTAPNMLERPGEPSEAHESRRFPLPNSRYASTDYVQVYANCRLRRIWFSEERPSSSLPWEFQLYGTVTP
ncbi:hypothetical protein SCHPADRAFT_818328 [Schizopora paradoxa]|uniref:CFA20 domain-containing protein n=1 Tax=Schizopora paradoxa TaxID=27342 RepID=A0A0H2SQI1_9AGAM|nr:hypothetical protein SCHPADRAFT_818328 [Schizopora paradoxa]